tara:strand:+ start:1062 stop:1289 length:228 start_codon:yes stop_codon:yes gene_type:complete
LTLNLDDLGCLQMKATGQAPAAIEYERAWNEIVENLPKWKYEIIINVEKDNPEWERLSADIAKQTRKLAEGRMSN